MKKILKFDFEKEIPFLRKENLTFREKEDNGQIYLDWVVNTLDALYNRNRKENEVYNTVCISMNSNNEDIFARYLSLMDFLSYSPRVNDDLEDDEFEVDFDEITEVVDSYSYSYKQMSMEIEKVRDIAKTFDVPIITATQVNRGSSESFIKNKNITSITTL